MKLTSVRGREPKSWLYPSKVYSGNIRKSIFNNNNLHELFVAARFKLYVETK